MWSTVRRTLRVCRSARRACDSRGAGAAGPLADGPAADGRTSTGVVGVAVERTGASPTDATGGAVSGTETGAVGSEGAAGVGAETGAAGAAGSTLGRAGACGTCTSRLTPPSARAEGAAMADAPINAITTAPRTTCRSLKLLPPLGGLSPQGGGTKRRGRDVG